MFFDKMKGQEEKKKAIISDGILFCSGMIAGEGLIGILLAVLAVFGFHEVIDLSGMIHLPEPLGTIASLGVFALVILSLLKFTVFKKRNKD